MMRYFKHISEKTPLGKFYHFLIINANILQEVFFCCMTCEFHYHKAVMALFIEIL